MIVTSEPGHTSVETLIYESEAVARAEIARILSLIRSDPVVRAQLGEPTIDELPDGAFLLRRAGRSVSVRPGVTGELGRGDIGWLADIGIAGPAIFVNIVECNVCITPHETDLGVLREISDQLGV